MTTVVIGSGHAGLAMSRRLAERAIDHVVLERGEVAHTWRTERWDSLRLLTPNWQSRLPGFSYTGDDPDGYRTMPQVIEFITDYAKAISDYDKYISLNTSNAAFLSDGYLNRGLVYVDMDNLEQAVKDITSAIELNPAKAKLYKARAFVYRKQGKTVLAEADEKKAASLAP